MIVMNPPWSKGEYKKHIKRAFDFFGRPSSFTDNGVAYYTYLYVICPRFHSRDVKPNDVVCEEFPWLQDEDGDSVYSQVHYVCDVNDFERVDHKGRVKPFKINACIYRFIVAN